MLRKQRTRSQLPTRRRLGLVGWNASDETESTRAGSCTSAGGPRRVSRCLDSSQRDWSTRLVSAPWRERAVVAQPRLALVARILSTASNSRAIPESSIARLVSALSYTCCLSACPGLAPLRPRLLLSLHLPRTERSRPLRQLPGALALPLPASVDPTERCRSFRPGSALDLARLACVSGTLSHLLRRDCCSFYAPVSIDRSPSPRVRPPSRLSLELACLPRAMLPRLASPPSLLTPLILRLPARPSAHIEKHQRCVGLPFGPPAEPGPEYSTNETHASSGRSGRSMLRGCILSPARSVPSAIRCHSPCSRHEFADTAFRCA